MTMQMKWKALRLALLLSATGFVPRPAVALLPFPLRANQRGTVTCLENHAITYDIYLPPAYATNGTPLPILYTMFATGGGMVSYFQSVCSSLNIIVVGITGSQNGATWDTEFQQFYAVSRDIRLRVLYDPTAEFAGGFSGGGETSYFFSRFRAQHVAGVLTIGGWMGRTGNMYSSTDRVATNLMVARISGTSDTATLYYIAPDSNYLASCGAVVKDWYISGGHSPTVPAATQAATLTWLVTNRITAGPDDRTNAEIHLTDWQTRVAAGQAHAVLYECVSNLMYQPRSWMAYQAQLVFDALATNYSSLRALAVTNVAQGDFAADFFYFYARGAATNNDRMRYYSALKALNGVIGASGDRAGDIYTQLKTTGYPAPTLTGVADNVAGQLNLGINEDAPGLAYTLQWNTNLLNALWTNVSVNAADTNTIWSAAWPLDPAASLEFFRVKTTPLPGTSPYWPVN